MVHTLGGVWGMPFNNHAVMEDASEHEAGGDPGDILELQRKRSTVKIEPEVVCWVSISATLVLTLTVTVMRPPARCYV